MKEDIYESDTIIIPYGIIQHVEKHWYPGDERIDDNYRGLLIITKHTYWNTDIDNWANNVYIDKKEVATFLQGWYKYIKQNYNKNENRN